MIKRTDKEWNALYDDMVFAPLFLPYRLRRHVAFHPSLPIHPTSPPNTITPMTTDLIHAHPSNPIDITTQSG